jgi:hypothetical protein
VLIAGVVSHPGTGDISAVNVTLHLAQCDGSLREAAVGKIDSVPRVLPALVDKALIVEAFIFDEPVTVTVAVVPDPVQSTVRVGKQRRDVFRGDSPAGDFAQQGHEQGCGVGAAVVGKR